MNPEQEFRGAIVLCGGKSRRMGRPKHLLPIGEETVIERVVRVIHGVATEIIVVGSKVEVPILTGRKCQVVSDTEEFPGPLAAFAQGLNLLSEQIDRAWLISCDMPLMNESVLKAISSRLDHDHDAVVVREGVHRQPFGGCYRLSVRPVITRLLRAGRRDLQALLDEIRVREMGVKELLPFDPQLVSLLNMNTPEDYESLLARVLK